MLNQIFYLPVFVLFCLFLSSHNMADHEYKSLPVNESVENSYLVPHTNQTTFYDLNSVISSVDESALYFYQDAGIANKKLSYTDHNNGTVSDNITGLMWQKELSAKMTFEEAQQQLITLNKGTYHDWRIPSIKELFSLIDYSGRVFGDKTVKPFINTNFFQQPIGDTAAGEREIDAQTWSATECKSKTMERDQSRYGVNFVDGRLKAYPVYNPRTGTPNKLYFRFVRGNPNYGKNKFVDNNDETITDLATGLMWQKQDNAKPITWDEALAYAKDCKLAKYNDWRMPTVKELQSIVDYSVAFEVNHKAAIDPVFEISQRYDPDGSVNYPYFWSGTTLLDGPAPGNMAAYICFGRSAANFNGMMVDAHGIGSVRCDPKTGANALYPKYFGPQGDLQYARNFVRCVREIGSRN